MGSIIEKGRDSLVKRPREGVSANSDRGIFTSRLRSDQRGEKKKLAGRNSDGGEVPAVAPWMSSLEKLVSVIPTTILDGKQTGSKRETRRTPWRHRLRQWRDGDGGTR